MKAWTDLECIHAPERIKRLAKDGRGYPVPFFASVLDGKADFRVMDPSKWRTCVEQRRCSICGEALDDEVAFVGGPVSIANHLFADAGMHPECATYALQACPFLAAPSFGYLNQHKAVDEGMAKNLDAVNQARPVRFGLGRTRAYRLVRLGHGGDIVIQAAQFDSVEWWKHGAKWEGVTE